MKKKKISTILMISVLSGLLLFAGGCGNSSSTADNATTERMTETAESEASAPDNAGNPSETADRLTDAAAVGSAATSETADKPSGDGSADASGDDASQTRKRVYTEDITAETKTFDELIKKLESSCTSLGGYAEHTDVSGNSYGYSINRNANFVFRIPQDQLSAFVQVIEEQANVTGKSENVEDITLTYVDTEAKISSLKAEQKALNTMLETAAKLDDMIKIRDRLSDVQYELESYESQLRTYDNQVSYSTVNLSLSEVERETSQKEKGFFAQAGERLSQSFYSIGRGLRSFAIWLIGALPHLVLWGGIIAVCIVVVKKIRKKKKEKKENRKKEAAKEKSE